MSFIAWFFLVYGVIALLSIRPVAGHFACKFHCQNSLGGCDGLGNRYDYDAPTSAIWTGSTCLAILIATVWPIFISFAIAKVLPSIGAEREYQLEERERRVKEAEEELDRLLAS
jgi:hypothetical protein